MLGINAAVMAQTTPNPLPALKAARWHEATREILLEARENDPNEPMLPKEMAFDGFTSDALDSARMLCRACQSAALVTVVSAPSSMSVEEKEHILNEALAILRSGSREPVWSTDTLTNAALIYSDLGLKAQAHSIFDEAITSATSDPASPSDFDRAAFALANAAPGGVPDWMVSSLEEATRRWPPSADTALAYRDLAIIRFQKSQPTAALDLMDKALGACSSIANKGQAQAIRASVGRLALDSNQLDFARHRIPAPLIIDAYASFEARNGNKDAALDFLQELPGPTLYVDVRDETLSQIIRDASNRGDFSTAKFFAGKIDPQKTHMQIELWTYIAREEHLKGDLKASEEDFRRILNIVDVMPIEQRQSLISEKGVLAEAMAKSEMSAESLRLSRSNKTSALMLSERQKAMNLDGLLSLAKAFHVAGDESEAKETLTMAYQIAHDYQPPNQYATTKSQLLMKVASTAAAFQ